LQKILGNILDKDTREKIETVARRLHDAMAKEVVITAFVAYMQD
jgi:hypothetical protein